LLAAALVSPWAAIADTTTWTITIPPITVQQTTSGTTAAAPATTTAPATATAPTTATTPTATAPATTTTPAPVAGQVAAITVGPGQAIAEPADALASIAPGGTITMLPGTYRKTLANSTANVTLRCQVSMKCVIDGQGGFGAGHRMAWGKACVLTTVTMTLDGIKFVNCGSPASGGNYSNEAAVYLDDDGTGTPNRVLTVRHCSFDNNANGIFANNAGGTVLVDESVFGFAAPNGMNGATNGTANGPAHDLYLHVAHVEVRGSYFYGSAAHNIKTRSPDTNAHDNPVLTSDGGRVVDLSDGGKLTFANNGVWTRDDTIFPKRTIQSGLRDGLWGNSNLLGVGTENLNAGAPSGALTGNTFNIGRQNSTFWVNAGSLTASGNKVGLFGSGSIQVQGNLTGDISGASAPPGAAAHAPAPPLPPSTWFSP
jgi:hypothetical protein